MQTIQLVLNDSKLEQQILSLAAKEKIGLEDFALKALQFYIEENESAVAIKIPNLNPFQHSRAPTGKIKEPRQTSQGLVFDDIGSTMDFAKNLRKKGWQRNG
ncbi:MAG: hypothetical protein KAG10_02825 [Methylococcales bacterium]|nr:hypothetical protein [Methylococcales bacterium]MCK5924805.1 hypothetical protein [Methylococcales bacterium]